MHLTRAKDQGCYDYIIVGAGSAGCVLARRLGEDADARILVLEAGGSDRALTVAMPAALSYPMNSRRFNWGFHTEPEPNMGGRRMNLPRGKGLGGSSSINGMCYVRGNPLDYERWHGLGAEGWNWANVLPYFMRAERALHGGEWRGREGPLSVSRGSGKNPLFRAFVEAGRQAGYAAGEMNDLRHEGFGEMEMTVGGGKRCSAAAAYLRPAMRRGNVKVLCGAHACKLVLEGRKAAGVLFLRGGKMHKARASREVVVSAGSVMSPVILKRSGIGPAEELARLGIATVLDKPEVGENLMDHLELYVQQKCRQPVSIYGKTTLAGKAMTGLRWLLFRDGAGASNHFEAGAHIRSAAGVGYPDIQFHFLPLAISYDGSSLFRGHGFQVHVGTKRSPSRGWVRLRDADALSAPRVCFNYMSSDEDWAGMRACVRFAREIFRQPAFAQYAGGELAPGEECQSDEQLNEFIRAKAESAYHPCGTCRMGSDDGAVVNPECAVTGMENLRVVDSSVMPQATAGDLNAPTIMLAERASDLIRGRSLPPANDAPVYADAQWQTRQRSPDVALNLAGDAAGLARAALYDKMNQPTPN